MKNILIFLLRTLINLLFVMGIEKLFNEYSQKAGFNDIFTVFFIPVAVLSVVLFLLNKALNHLMFLHISLHFNFLSVLIAFIIIMIWWTNNPIYDTSGFIKAEGESLYYRMISFSTVITILFFWLIISGIQIYHKYKH